MVPRRSASIARLYS